MIRLFTKEYEPNPQFILTPAVTNLAKGDPTSITPEPVKFTVVLLKVRLPFDNKLPAIFNSPEEKLIGFKELQVIVLQDPGDGKLITVDAIPTGKITSSMVVGGTPVEGNQLPIFVKLLSEAPVQVYVTAYAELKTETINVTNKTKINFFMSIEF